MFKHLLIAAFHLTTVTINVVHKFTSPPTLFELQTTLLRLATRSFLPNEALATAEPIGVAGLAQLGTQVDSAAEPTGLSQASESWRTGFEWKGIAASPLRSAAT